MFLQEIYLQKTKDIFLTMHFISIRFCVFVEGKHISSESKNSLSNKEISHPKKALKFT